MVDKVRENDMECQAIRKNDKVGMEFIPTLRDQLEMKGGTHSNPTSPWRGSIKGEGPTMDILHEL